MLYIVKLLHYLPPYLTFLNNLLVFLFVNSNIDMDPDAK